MRRFKMKHMAALALVLIMSIGATTTAFARGGFGGGRMGQGEGQVAAGQARDDNEQWRAQRDTWRAERAALRNEMGSSFGDFENCRFDCISFDADGNIVFAEGCRYVDVDGNLITRESFRQGRGAGICRRLQDKH